MDYIDLKLAPNHFFRALISHHGPTSAWAGAYEHTRRPLAGPLQAHVTLPSTILAGVTSSSPPSGTETSVAKNPPSIGVPVTIQIVVNEVNDDLSISNPCVTTLTLAVTNTPIETNYMMPRKPTETTNSFLRKQDGRREDLPILICNKRANPAAGTATSMATHIDNAATVITWNVEIVDSMATNRNTVNPNVIIIICIRSLARNALPMEIMFLFQHLLMKTWRHTGNIIMILLMIPIALQVQIFFI